MYIYIYMLPLLFDAREIKLQHDAAEGIARLYNDSGIAAASGIFSSFSDANLMIVCMARDLSLYFYNVFFAACFSIAKRVYTRRLFGKYT